MNSTNVCGAFSDNRQIEQTEWQHTFCSTMLGITFTKVKIRDTTFLCLSNPNNIHWPQIQRNSPHVIRQHRRWNEAHLQYLHITSLLYNHIYKFLKKVFWATKHRCIQSLLIPINVAWNIFLFGEYLTAQGRSMGSFQ